MCLHIMSQVFILKIFTGNLGHVIETKYNLEKFHK